jgi:hypothetical protein
MKYILMFLLIVSCNAFEALLDAESQIDDGFNQEVFNIQSLENGKIGFWRFDEPKNSNRFSNNGSIVFNDNVGVSTIDGIRGSALNCSSVDNAGSRYLDTGTISPVYTVPSPNGFNISFWLKIVSPPNSGAATSQIVLDYGGAQIQFGEPSVAGRLGFTVNMSGLVLTLDGVSNISQSNWNHFSFNLFTDHTQNRIFVNGSNQPVSTATGTAVTFSSFALCSDTAGNLSLTSGLDSLGIWDRALTIDEISALASGNTQLD